MGRVLRANSDSDSNSIRTLNPIQSGHQFLGKSDSDSDLEPDYSSLCLRACPSAYFSASHFFAIISRPIFLLIIFVPVVKGGN